MIYSGWAGRKGKGGDGVLNRTDEARVVNGEPRCNSLFSQMFVLMKELPRYACATGAGIRTTAIVVQ